MRAQNPRQVESSPQSQRRKWRDSSSSQNKEEAELTNFSKPRASDVIFVFVIRMPESTKQLSLPAAATILKGLKGIPPSWPSLSSSKSYPSFSVGACGYRPKLLPTSNNSHFQTFFSFRPFAERILKGGWNCNCRARNREGEDKSLSRVFIYTASGNSSALPGCEPKRKHTHTHTEGSVIRIGRYEAKEELLTWSYQLHSRAGPTRRHDNPPKRGRDNEP